MLKEPSNRVNAIKPSPTLAVSAKAAELKASGKDIINLSVGEPDFDTPSHIKEAAIQAINNGETKYTAVDGTKALKQAVIQKFARDNSLEFTDKEIIISCGAKHSLFNLFAAILNPNDEIIIPSPFWVSYPDIAKLVGAIPVFIRANHAQQFKITPAQLRAAITPKTRLIILNSPSNPTGISYKKEELEALGQIIAEYPNLIVATDDIYEQTLWEGEFSNILTANPKLRNQTVIINGVSKAYAMTGWRIGYTAGPTWIIAAMKKIQSQSTSNPSSISQAAATAALSGDQSCITSMRDTYRKRHDFLIEFLNKIPNTVIQPSQGTFYTFPFVGSWIKQSKNIQDDIQLAEFLLTTAGVAVVPGSAFGAPNYIRISYATSMDIIKDAIKRITNALQSLD